MTLRRISRENLKSLELTKEYIIDLLRETSRKGTLITDKHNPYKLSTLPFMKIAPSVISFEITDNVDKFLNEGIKSIYQYANLSYPKSPLYLEIVPTSFYSICSSGVTSFPFVPSYTLDRVVAVYGNKQGPHIFGEHSRIIIESAIQKKLINKIELF